MELRVYLCCMLYLCVKLRVAGVKGYHGLLWYPNFLECSVVQGSADIC